MCISIPLIQLQTFFDKGKTRFQQQKLAFWLEDRIFRDPGEISFGEIGLLIC